MGGKGSAKADNSAIVNQQNQQAAEAKQKEADRQARINKGLASIKDAFEGASVMGTKSTPFDWNSIADADTSPYRVVNGQAVYNDPTSTNNYGLPTGYKVIQVAKPTAQSAQAAEKAKQGFTANGKTYSAADIAKMSSQEYGQTGLSAADYYTAREAVDPNYGKAAAGSVGSPGSSGAGGAAGGYGSAPQVGSMSWAGGRGAYPIQPNQFGVLTDVMSGNSYGGYTPGWGGGGAQTPNEMVNAIQGPDGKIYYQGDNFNIDQSYDTGQKSGGFDDAFYNKYKQSVLDYYMPQVDKQYKDAKDELTYRLGRSGNLRSSAATTEVADLSTQNDLNQAGVRNQADKAAGDLRTQVASEKAKATSQLYATEDPEVAADQSLAAVRNISLEQPDLSPLSGIFNIASIGGANLLKGYNNQKNFNAYATATGKDSTRNVGTG